MTNPKSIKRLRAFNDPAHAAAWLGPEWTATDVVDTAVRFGVRLFVWVKFDADDPRPLPFQLKDGTHVPIIFPADLNMLRSQGEGQLTHTTVGGEFMRFTPPLPIKLDEVRMTEDALLDLAQRLAVELQARTALHRRTENNYLRLIMQMAVAFIPDFDPHRPHEAARMILDKIDSDLSRKTLAGYIQEAYEIELKNRA